MIFVLCLGLMASVVSLILLGFKEIINFGTSIYLSVIILTFALKFLVLGGAIEMLKER